MDEDYEAAEDLLESIPNANENIINFKEVQRINLKQLRTVNGRYEATGQDLKSLEKISYSKTPSAGYAWSLYYYLTGVQLPIDIPLSSRAIQARSESIVVTDDELLFYPNPATDWISLTEDARRQYHSFIIRAIDGSTIKSYIEKAIEGISTQNLADGVYLIEFIASEDKKLTKKLIIKH